MSNFNNTTNSKPVFFVHGKGVGLRLPLVDGKKVCLTEASRMAINTMASKLTGHEVYLKWNQGNWQSKTDTVYWCGPAAWYTDAMADQLVKLVEARHVNEGGNRQSKTSGNRILGGSQPATIQAPPQVQQQPQVLGNSDFPIADRAANPTIQTHPKPIQW